MNHESSVDGESLQESPAAHGTESSRRVSSDASAQARLKRDVRIQHDVLRELGWDSRVREAGVGVSVENGVVTLSGTVANILERRAAEDAAHRVAGVLDVADELEVREAGAGAPTDGDIALAVRLALESSVLVPHARIRSTVSDGTVVLEGMVDYWAERDAADQAVRRVTEVLAIDNRLEIAQPVVRDELVQAVQAALERRAVREARRIEVTLNDGEVTLLGGVRSWTERRAVLGAVLGTPGVRLVRDGLRIEPEV